ncbi:NusG domain II-containing protein [Oceanispirochaeta sp.]|uniref:NusG domain II-containing protein n=1 Tax=Oceanispirochaeta sp. TaxID=2035350 RepID=UPI002621A446|nr:NusG domain II-containing protein [Oceanispirochaeta sp.]MDA3955962.1 NusG domain II-containing protein [Oceanispirochaeta sp.]
MKLRFFDILALVFSLAVFLLFTLYGRSISQEEGYIIIEDVQGKSIYPLTEDRELHLKGPVGKTILSIQDGQARFVFSDCRDQLCVQMGEIHRGGEWAACLPNKIFMFTGGKGEDQEVDAGVY